MDEGKVIEVENMEEWKKTLDDLLRYVVFQERKGKKSKDLVYNHLFASLKLKIKED